MRRSAEAVRDWERALGFAADANRSWFRLQHALALAQAGEHAAATATAEQLAKLGAVSGDWLYSLACVEARAVTAAAADAKLVPEEQRLLAEGYAARGIEFLEKARLAGYFRAPANRAKLKTDRDLAPLRSHPDFEKLLGNETGPR